MPVAVSWATLVDQKIIFMNRKFTSVFGYIVDDLSLISEWIAHYPLADDRALAEEQWGSTLSLRRARSRA